MDENERDVLDSEVQSFLMTCSDHIRRVKKLCDLSMLLNSTTKVFFFVASTALPSQLNMHRKLICEYLGDDFKSMESFTILFFISDPFLGACTLYDRQKAMRAKRIVNRKKL